MNDNNNSTNQTNNDSKDTNDKSLTLHQPKHIKRNLLDLERSKSAPIEEVTDDDKKVEYLSSYNYFVYYNSIKPRDPRLPKPTYKPVPDLAFIKETMNKEEEEDKDEKSNNNNDLNEEFNKLSLDEHGNTEKNEKKNNINDNMFKNKNSNRI